MRHVRQGNKNQVIMRLFEGNAQTVHCQQETEEALKYINNYSSYCALVAENHAQFLQSCSRKGTIDRHLPFTEAFLEKRGIRTTRAKFTILHENFPLQMSS